MSSPLATTIYKLLPTAAKLVIRAAAVVREAFTGDYSEAEKQAALTQLFTALDNLAK